MSTAASPSSSTPGIWSQDVPNQTPKFVIVSIVFLTLTSLVVFVRFAWRWAHKQRGMDDAMALCAYINLVIMSVFGFIAADFGFGKPMAYIMPTLTKALEYFYLYQICYKLLGGFTKLTFCFLYLRIFPQKNINRLIIAIAVITAVGSFVFALVTVFQCTPVARAWNHQIPGTCTNNGAFWYSHAAFNTIGDIVIYILPIPLIGTLKLARGQKTGLISIFSLGAFVIAASIVRMVSLRASASTTDPTWGSTTALTWTEIEGNTSVICCCMPALRVPFLNLWRHITGHGGTHATSVQSDNLPRDGTWSGPARNIAEVHHAPTAGHPPPRQFHSSRKSRSANKNSNNSSTSDSKGAGEWSWYDRMLQSLSRGEKDVEISRSSSQDEFAKSMPDDGHGLPEIMELGAIYKTTDLHVSTSDVQRESTNTNKQDGEVSFHDFLNERPG